MTPTSTRPLTDSERHALLAIAEARHGDPFSVLGPHRSENGWLVRTCQPGAQAVTLTRPDGTALTSLEQSEVPGIFIGELAHNEPYVLHIEWPGGVQVTEDAYAFPPLLGELDLHLLAEGRHRELGRCLGAQPMTINGVPGVRFAVWAPNAQRVSVVGNFNSWDTRRNPMRLRYEAGVWELFIPRLTPGTLYKYAILGAHGEMLPLKADPIALQAESNAGDASVVADPTPFAWTDDEWMAQRDARQAPEAPLAIYEVHASSWLRRDGEPDWQMLADRLIPYASNMGFTHIELLPIMSHPFGGSWGYQPLGLFAPQASLGSPRDFAHFVDRCHAAGLGVILDWVPAHFPSDAHGLARFDGTALYEHADPREGFHKDWNTLIYNFGRHEVRGFLIASALHWIEHFHVDGLRVDAVASMLYRDYSRSHGEWVPNIHGGRENLEAIAFLRELNGIVADRCPGAVMIAEESTAWPGVTAPVSQGGLGFHYKWNMGWMHDTLHYMKEPPIYRRWHHDEMTFGLVYAWSENFVLPISHDEVVHGKGTLLTRMPDDEAGSGWQRFANLRAYLAFMWTHPGKKLLFMGGEFGQFREWNHDAEIDWNALDNSRHRGVQRLLRDLNRVYRSEPALHARDCEPSGFSWVIGDDRDNSVFAYMRHDGRGVASVLVVCNLTPVPRPGYRIGVPETGMWHELVNTDSDVYDGSNSGNGGAVRTEDVSAHGHSQSLSLLLPPLATLVMKRDAES